MQLDTLTQRLAQFVLLLRNRHFFFLDLVLLLFIPFLALELREDGALQTGQYLIPLVVYSVSSLPFWIGAFLVSGLYTRYWQYASVDEVATVLKAVVLGTGLNIAWLFLGLRPLGWVPDAFPRSIPLITGMLVFVGIGGVRFSVRFLDRLQRQRQSAGHPRRNVVVYGAGEAGMMIVREMQANPQLGLYPVVFLDDDPRKRRTVIHGVPVAGGRDALAKAARDFHARDVIIAMPTAPGKAIREIAAECMHNELSVKTVPGMFELLDGSVTVSKLRNVEIDDLLRREPVTNEPAAVSDLLRGKRVLITGAGGSIGGELCRQIARCNPAQLILLGRGENTLFYQTYEMNAAFPDLPMASLVADIRDAPRIEAIMAKYKPQLVFHAAAHKHVTLMEHNVEDAVTNNVLGTCTLLEAALANGLETFVLISSDKAVKPVSVMGATKRVAELYVHARALETGKALVVVRFGNVLGSRASVVPIFKKQIASGGPVKVSHPDVRRFFMTIPEAVQLVLQAATLGRGGEIFTLDMGEPVRIVDLAADMIRLSGLQVGQDIEIEFTGLRPGEKMSEELFVPGERYEKTPRDKIYVARNGASAAADAHARLYASLDELICRARKGDPDGVREQLAVIVPDFQGATQSVVPALKRGAPLPDTRRGL